MVFFKQKLIRRAPFIRWSPILLIVLFYPPKISFSQSELDRQLMERDRVYSAPKLTEESALTLPKVSPKDAFSLYQTNNRSGFKFYVDISTVQISDNDVVRMTLLAVSPKGSNNLTHEGFRCSTGEYKLYATAWSFNSDWMPMKNPLWLVTNKKTPSRYRYDLLESYICSGRIIFEGQEELRLRFKKGKLAKPRDRGRI